jgi:hypothetical protein
VWFNSLNCVPARSNNKNWCSPLSVVLPLISISCSSHILAVNTPEDRASTIPESSRGKNRSICSIKAGGAQHIIIIIPRTGYIIAAFLKLLAMAYHFIGGGSTRGPPSYNYPHPKCMQVNRWNIISVVKVTITTPFLYIDLKYFLK